MVFLFKVAFWIVIVGSLVACSSQSNNKTVDQSQSETGSEEAMKNAGTSTQPSPDNLTRIRLVLDPNGNPVSKSSDNGSVTFAANLTDPGNRGGSNQPGVRASTDKILSFQFTSEQVKGKIESGETVLFSALPDIQKNEVCTYFVFPADPFLAPFPKCDENVFKTIFKQP